MLVLEAGVLRLNSFSKHSCQVSENRILLKEIRKFVEFSISRLFGNFGNYFPKNWLRQKMSQIAKCCRKHRVFSLKSFYLSLGTFTVNA